MPDRAQSSYKIAKFIAAIEGLQRRTPQSDEFPVPAGHASLKGQWLRWLGEYLEPGYYDRKNAVDDAQWGPINTSTTAG